MTGTSKPKKYKDAVQDATKFEATHLDDKFKPSKGSKPKEPWPFTVSGKPVKQDKGSGK